ncbi:DMT family transporter [Sinisalibacter aestuarii]|uniref:DMT transporter permease n=1 Tax=Sinisalibacter aestuarii TaxID=2949426 RepID=A0ABQ5LSR8_9RHOB|nr:DMT family transporter [Sinisalibacter aestuarii]GKY87778.1 DMT transporter permease [Sinisalibacter aestuarii]
MTRLTPTALGIVLYLFAILTMSIVDTAAKTLSAELPVIQIVWARYAGQTLIVTLIVLPRIGQVVRTAYPGLQFLRSLFLLGATSLFFLSISRMGLAEATALMDINPVLITLGAALFLGEKIGLRRAIGIGAALVGALIVIRPGSAVFSLTAVLPLAAAFFYASFALATRRVGHAETVWTSLFYTALLGAVVLSLAVIPFWVAPSGKAIALMALIGSVAALAQFLIIRAFMLAEASVVAPFSYIGLLFAALWGMIFFGDVPDGPTIIGAGIIVAAGVYVWHRETRDARAARQAQIREV